MMENMMENKWKARIKSYDKIEEMSVIIVIAIELASTTPNKGDFDLK